ncbi:glucan endo-1 3-beta-d-glucosidase [Phtheirospermum japonicum]|uniref:Glucan endo-1 3-beta-d-glucosidase n=1 Tax=Phtheirospermum japonicum TaxID=374723 RepID=A0A830AY64_9LAMI|nr:glucan endo-1 3-beta-d-glucosidase [Phtheirospermum japonicum]
MLFQANSWCVLQGNVPDERAQAFINYACGVVDCTAIQPGGPCFYPNSPASHASYALNLNYKKFRGSCNRDIAFVTTTDPCNISFHLSIYIHMFYTYEMHITNLIMVVFVQPMEVADIHE